MGGNMGRRWRMQAGTGLARRRQGVDRCANCEEEAMEEEAIDGPTAACSEIGGAVS
jgi:hypothetical protein